MTDTSDPHSPFYQGEDFSDPDSEECEQNDTLDAATVGNWKIVDLPVIAPITGQEQEDVVATFKAKAFRFREEEWKERGTGLLKFLKHKISGLIRIVMRAEKTGKCLLNHRVLKQNGACKLEKLQTSNKAWTWIASDFSDQVASLETICVKLLSEQESDHFAQQFAHANSQNEQLMAEKVKAEAGQNKQKKLK